MKLIKSQQHFCPLQKVTRCHDHNAKLFTNMMKRFTSSYPSFFLLFLFLFLFLCSTSGISFPFDSLHVPEKLHNEELSWKSVVDGFRSNKTLVLAQERTRRKDFFNHFERYTGGWNITNPYYISSVLSTSVPFFAAAAAWFVIFGLLLHLICVCYCCCPGEPYGYSKSASALSFIFIILFTIAAIGGCVVLYLSQREFHGSTSNTVDYVVNQAEFTTQNLRNVSSYFDSAKQIAFGLGLSPHVGRDIDDVKKKISAAAANLSNKTEDNSQMLHRGIDGMRLALIIVAAVVLIVAVLGFLFSILGLQCAVYSLVVVGWILVAGTFILCGAFLFLHNVIGDTCVAMDDWVLNPTAHTALDEILPCVENATVLETFLQSKTVTYLLVNSVDNIISSVLNANTMPYNQSGPLMPLLCNPFNSDYTVPHCAAEEVSFQNTTEVWKNYVCEVSSLGICVTPGRMTPSLYTQLTAAVNVTYGLYHYGPFLVDLVDCSFVRKTFTDISSNHCPGLRRCTKWIFWGSVVVSVAVMLSLIFWIIYEREWRHRRYIKRS